MTNKNNSIEEVIAETKEDLKDQFDEYLEYIDYHIKQAYQAGKQAKAEEVLEYFKCLKKEAEIANEPVFLMEMNNQIEHLKTFNL